MAFNPALAPEIGPDGLPKEAPIIAYTEKIIEEEQLQLRKYIEENYSKIRDVERELTSLTMEMKLTAGPKKAALEHMRKKIEMSTERIRAARIKEEQAKKVWEAAAKVVQDEEAIKQKLCEDLNQLVQESSNSQYTRLEELKRRLEALNPSRASAASSHDLKPSGQTQTSTSGAPSIPVTTVPANNSAKNVPSQTNVQNSQVVDGQHAAPSVDGEVRGKKKVQFHGKGRGIGVVPKGRGAGNPGWTGAGFDVDDRS